MLVEELDRSREFGLLPLQLQLHEAGQGFELDLTFKRTSQHFIRRYLLGKELGLGSTAGEEESKQGEE